MPHGQSTGEISKGRVLTKQLIQLWLMERVWDMTNVNREHKRYLFINRQTKREGFTGSRFRPFIIIKVADGWETVQKLKVLKGKVKLVIQKGRNDVRRLLYDTFFFTIEGTIVSEESEYQHKYTNRYAAVCR